MLLTGNISIEGIPQLEVDWRIYFKLNNMNLLDKLIDTKSEKYNIIDRIQDFSDVLELVEVSPKQFRESCKNLTEDEIAYKALKLITKAYNQGWKPNWNDPGEEKYYGWFSLNGSASEKIFASRIACFDLQVGGRLVFKDRDGCMDAANKFLFVYKIFFGDEKI